MATHLPWTYSAKNPPRAEQPKPRQGHREMGVRTPPELSDAQLLAQAWRDLQARQAKEARVPRRCAVAEHAIPCDYCRTQIAAGTRYSTVIIRGTTLLVHRDCVSSLV